MRSEDERKKKKKRVEKLNFDDKNSSYHLIAFELMMNLNKFPRWFFLIALSLTDMYESHE